jgi:hypothetical protein
LILLWRILLNNNKKTGVGFRVFIEEEEEFLWDLISVGFERGKDSDLFPRLDKESGGHTLLL